MMKIDGSGGEGAAGNTDSRLTAGLHPPRQRYNGTTVHIAEAH